MKTNRVKKPGLGAVLAGLAAMVAGLGGPQAQADIAEAWGINDAGELANGTYDQSGFFGYRSTSISGNGDGGGGFRLASQMLITRGGVDNSAARTGTNLG